MKIVQPCKTMALRCKSVAAATAHAIGEELEREIHWRAISEFRRENPRNAAKLLAIELGVSVRLAYYLLSGKVLLRMGQVGVMGIKRGAGFVNRVVVEPMAARAAQHRDAHDARQDARQTALEQQLAAEEADLEAEVARGGAGNRRPHHRLFSILGTLSKGRRHPEAAA